MRWCISLSDLCMAKWPNEVSINQHQRWPLIKVVIFIKSTRKFTFRWCSTGRFSQIQSNYKYMSLWLQFTCRRCLQPHTFGALVMETENHRRRGGNYVKNKCLISLWIKQTHQERSIYVFHCGASCISEGINPLETTHIHNCLIPPWDSLKH